MGKNRVYTKEMHEAYRQKVEAEQEAADEQARERQFERLSYRVWNEAGRPGTLTDFQKSLREHQRESAAKQAQAQSEAARAQQRRLSRI